VAFHLHAAGGRPSRLLYFASWWVAGAAGSALVALRALRASDAAAGAPARAPLAAAGFLASFLASSAALGLVLGALERAVRARFSPLAARELERGRSLVRVDVPDGENAAPLYEQAFTAMADWTDWPDFVSLACSRPDFEPSRPEVRSFLRQQEAVLALLRAAAEKPRCAFPEGERISCGVDVGKLTSLSRAHLLLCLDALWKASERDLDGALADLKSLEGIARHAREVPLFLGELIAQVCTLQHARTVEKALSLKDGLPVAGMSGWRPASVHPGSFRFEADAALALGSALSLLLPDPEGQWDTPRMLGLTDAIDELIGTGSGPGPWLLRGGLRARYYRVFVLPGEVTAHEKGVERWRSLAAKAAPAVLDEAEDLARSSPGERFPCLTFFGACKRTFRDGLRMEALGECLRLALAADAFRRANGRYPGEAADLTPKFRDAPPLDPVDGRPLRLEPVEGGLTVHAGGAGQAIRLGSAYEEEVRKAAAEGPIDYARVSSAEDAED
jgi:hypothetical protein